MVVVLIVVAVSAVILKPIRTAQLTALFSTQVAPIQVQLLSEGGKPLELGARSQRIDCSFSLKFSTCAFKNRQRPYR